MTNYKTRIATAIATGSVLLQALAGSTFAATTITINGNGDSSNNTANVTRDSDTTVVQNNDANITNNVDVNSSTGYNDANRNTGGDVTIDTGNATANVTISNQANANSADVQGCGACAGGDVTVNITKNGVDSVNDVDVRSYTDTGVYQDNHAHIDNDVDVDAKTGGNDADRNTGGNVEITTGDADTTVNLSTAANVNHAVVGGGSGNGGGISALIKENGDSSSNDIDLNFDNDVTVSQDNRAHVDNDVDVYGSTGYNDANRNTGGDVTIDTGDATADITVDNMVNFNAADVEDCCIEDVEASIEKNGVDSENSIDVDLDFNDGEDDGTFQNNHLHLDNDLRDVDLKTGGNDADRNTGSGDSDPSVTTGDADATVDVSNQANVNTYGSDAQFDFPNMDFHFNFDWNALMEWLLSHSN